MSDSIEAICRSLRFYNLFHEIQFTFVKVHRIASYVLPWNEYFILNLIQNILLNFHLDTNRNNTAVITSVVVH